MNYNPSIYEINTRVWLKQFCKENKTPSLKDVPAAYWDQLAEYGIDYVWLMGIWKVCGNIIEKYCFAENLVKSYDKALKGWEKKDVVGSPFAIDVYDVNPLVGNKKSLAALKAALNKRGVKLILDFVPNHFSAGSSLLKTNPGAFLSVDKATFERDPYTYFQPFEDEEKYYAHGRDPFFPAWQDTVQVNFFSQQARELLTNLLLQLTGICDGVRCDMAMLALNNVFKNNWGSALSGNDDITVHPNFWQTVIKRVKKERSDFIFIAETYWDLEWTLQQQGFDFTYDKKLTDRLKNSPPSDVLGHLQAEQEYQGKSLRFIENHDEERALTTFGKNKSKAAAVIISTIRGMRFYNDGQFEGRKVKLPVQLGRAPLEPENSEIKNFYKTLLSITSQGIFKLGNWQLLEPLPSWDGNEAFKNILAWLWTLGTEKLAVIINYSNTITACRLKLDVRGYQEEFLLNDLLNNQTYTRSAEEVLNTGLYIELKPYMAHIFSF
jgi:glycosidase